MFLSEVFLKSLLFWCLQYSTCTASMGPPTKNHRRNSVFEFSKLSKFSKPLKMETRKCRASSYAGKMGDNKRPRDEDNDGMRVFTHSTSIFSLSSFMVVSLASLTQLSEESNDAWQLKPFNKGDMKGQLLAESSFAVIFPKTIKQYLYRSLFHISATPTLTTIITSSNSSLHLTTPCDPSPCINLLLDLH